jgi:hypothetical protein
MDFCDIGSAFEERERTEAIANRDTSFDKGVAGVCDLCGFERERIVRSAEYMACAKCRDENKLP